MNSDFLIHGVQYAHAANPRNYFNEFFKNLLLKYFCERLKIREIKDPWKFSAIRYVFMVFVKILSFSYSSNIAQLEVPDLLVSLKVTFHLTDALWDAIVTSFACTYGNYTLWAQSVIPANRQLMMTARRTMSVMQTLECTLVKFLANWHRLENVLF